MTDYVEAPHITLDNDGSTLRDESVRAFIEAENDKAAALFSQIGETDDEREQMQHYADALVVVYRAGYLAAKAMLEARSVQVQKLLDLNDEAHRSLVKARDDLAASRAELQRQRAARVEPRDAGVPIVINVSAAKPGSKRVERDHAGNIVRVVDESDDAMLRPAGNVADS
jgi:hypothetical protein